MSCTFFQISFEVILLSKIRNWNFVVSVFWKLFCSKNHYKFCTKNSVQCLPLNKKLCYESENPRASERTRTSWCIEWPSNADLISIFFIRYVEEQIFVRFASPFHRCLFTTFPTSLDIAKRFKFLVLQLFGHFLFGWVLVLVSLGSDTLHKFIFSRHSKWRELQNLVRIGEIVATKEAYLCLSLTFKWDNQVSSESILERLILSVPARLSLWALVECVCVFRDTHHHHHRLFVLWHWEACADIKERHPWHAVCWCKRGRGVSQKFNLCLRAYVSFLVKGAGRRRRVPKLTPAQPRICFFSDAGLPLLYHLRVCTPFVPPNWSLWVDDHSLSLLFLSHHHQYQANSFKLQRKTSKKGFRKKLERVREIEKERRPLWWWWWWWWCLGGCESLNKM